MLVQGSHVRILHLEDNPIDAELAEANLVGADFTFEVYSVSNSEDFIEAITSDSIFDAILSDYNVPGFDGMVALSMAKIHKPSTPFIFLSGALGDELAVETLRNGATDYVLKDKMDRLLPVIRRAINENRSQIKQQQFQKEMERAKEEAEKANAAKSHFLSRISHELRTPLNAILGYTQLMQTDPLNEDQTHCTSQILKAGKHLLNLINEVLDISRIEAGQLKLIIKDVPINYIIRQAIDLVEPFSREEQVEFSVITDENSDLLVLADEDRITQVLINLLTNAIKYNHPNGKAIITCRQERPGFAKITVTDTGRGIDPDKISRVFIPFDRLDAEHETKIPGTGLGLSVAKGFIEAMNGSLHVSSELGKSTTFWFELPLSNSSVSMKETIQPVAQESEIPAHDSTTIKILVAEDNPVNADFMTRVFKRYPQYSMHLAINGREAIHACQTINFDLVLLDLHLPDLSGLEVLSRVHEFAPNLPVIFITADASPETTETISRSTAISCLNKPVNIIEMLEVIGNTLNAAQR